MSKRSNPIRLLSHMLAALFNSRAAFHQQWELYQSGLENDRLTGRWTGEWISEQSGHRGELKCVLSPTGANTYRAFFYASYSKWFRVGYATELKAEPGKTGTHLHGEEDLGPLAGGVYSCDGEVSDSEFLCRYSCKYDHGIFRLKRFR